MHRATKQSGAFLTMARDGLVRGCRTCKAPLASDMSCPKCGPREVGTAAALAGKDCERALGIPLADRTCRICGYVEHALTCPIIPADQWRLCSSLAAYEHIPSGKRLSFFEAFACGLVQRIEAQAYGGYVGPTVTLGNAYQWLANQSANVAGATITYSTGTVAQQAYGNVAGTYADSSNTFKAVEHKPSNFAEYIAQRNGSK